MHQPWHDARMRGLLFILIGLGFPAFAQQQYIKYSSGTGFFVSREGHVITNAHVVKACQRISLQTPQGEVPAELVAADRERDLAVLKTSSTPQEIASLRWNISDLQVGAQLWLYGFPGEAGANGRSSFARTKLVGMEGPGGNPLWLQLQNAAQHGNSGGPVLDASGNVIAVITGIAETYRPAETPGGQMTFLGSTDVAITLAALEDFLRQNRVPFYGASSGLVGYAEPILERNAARFTFPVRCVQGTVVK